LLQHPSLQPIPVEQRMSTRLILPAVRKNFILTVVVYMLLGIPQVSGNWIAGLQLLLS
jgi:hypothetical protein